MKIFKLFLVLVAISSVTFYSCSDENPIQNIKITQKSVALRTVLNELKTANDIGGRTVTETPFCFDFVYPITLSYNNGTAITIASFQGLLEVIVNESSNLYIVGIVFPFQVTGNGAITTINDENEFFTYIENCDFNTINDDLLNSYCFDLVFPIGFQQNGQVVTIDSIEELSAFLNAPNSNYEAQIVFPISVLYNGQTIVIANLYEFYEMVNNCDTCICTLEYAPVCVQTTNGVVEFGNICFAQCEGYTQNDLVPCTPVTECSITNVSAVPGDCIPGSFIYPLTIDFDVANSTETQFEVFSSGNILIGVYPITSLPITIANYPPSVLGIPNINSVNIKITGNNEYCSAFQTFTIPNCANCICTTDYLPVCVQSGGEIVEYGNACLAQCAGFTPNDFVTCLPATFNFMESLGPCFNIMYPVTVQYQGALVTVNSNSELVQYYNPQTQTMPVMNYPIAVTWGLQTATFTYANQVAFESAIILANCP